MGEEIRRVVAAQTAEVVLTGPTDVVTVWFLRPQEWHMLEAICLQAKGKQWRRQSGLVTELLEVPRNYLESCILGTVECSYEADGEDLGGLKTIHLEYGTLFCTTRW